jgi:hypothetical protein
MIPNLGWDEKVLETTLPRLRQLIIDNRFKISSGDENFTEIIEKDKKELTSHLENEFGYFDVVYGQTVKEKLEAITPQSLLSTLPFPTTTQVCFHKSNVFDPK